jgi:hypothetical protein
MAVSEHEAIWNKPQRLTTNPGGAPKLMLEAFRIEQYNLFSLLGGASWIASSRCSSPTR